MWTILSEAYTGFRIVHKGQLEGFLAGAQSGFGHIKIYIPFLDFLCKEGFFEEARNLFEQWIEHRPDDKEQYNAQLMGCLIYSNLLEFDKAIEWFKRITETSESSLAFANLGKLYLVKGEREKAIEYLKKSKDVSGDLFLKRRTLSVIDKKEWQPLKLSLCMIARDEEADIGKAMKSLDGIVDEIIVVDTGSSDRTKEIVKEFGGKVIETKWEDHFSKARNLGIEEAFESIHDPLKILEGGILFLRLGDLDRAFPWLIKTKEMNHELSAKIGTLYSKQNKPEMAKNILTGALKQFPDSSELILSMAEVYYKEENYNEVINILANRIDAIDKNLESEDAARAVYYHGIASLETGNLGDGIEYLAFAHEKNPANILYKIAGIYAFSKVDQWEEALQAAAQIADEEGIEIESKINDFVDVGRVFVELNLHFTKEAKMEEANLCHKIVEDVIKNKISGEEDIQRISEVIEGIGSHG